MKWLLSKGVLVVILVTAVAAGTVVAAFAHGAGPRDGQAEREGGPKSGQRHGGPKIGQLLAEATGLEPEELRAEFEAGKTPAQVLTENGVDPDVFLAGVLTEMETRLEQAVADGKIDQERADQMLANAGEKMAEKLNEPVTFGEGGRGRGHGRAPRPGGEGQDAGFPAASFDGTSL